MPGPDHVVMLNGVIPMSFQLIPAGAFRALHTQQQLARLHGIELELSSEALDAIAGETSVRP